MTFSSVHSGSRIASEARDSALFGTGERVKVQSLADLLEHLDSRPPSQTPMLRSTAAKIAVFLGKAPEDIPLDLIHLNRERFRPFLESRTHKEGAIRSYVNYLRILMKLAEELGWRPLAAIATDWQLVFDAAAKNDCVTIVKWLANVKQSPSDVNQDDLDSWVSQRVLEGMRYATLQHKMNACWRTLIACGYVQNAPIQYLRKKYYGVPLSELPSPLKDELVEILRWKTSDFEPDRPKDAKIRNVSAKNLRQTFCKLYGFAVKIAALGDLSSMERLIQKPVIAEFISWCINHQKVEGAALVPQLSAVLTAVSQHPSHREMALGWFRPLLDTIPTEGYTEAVKARKAKKYLDYAVLESIPEKIRSARATQGKYGEEHIARLVLAELIIAWLLVFPWRQSNIRKFRVGGPNPNLFRDKLPAFSYIDKPEWVRTAELEDPDAEFWQIRFSRKETKTKIPVHVVVPRHLVPLLEEYLTQYRPVLVGKRHCVTLFPLSNVEDDKNFVNNLVSEFTLRYGGRRVTPHLIRDIVAFAWLKEHPSDYLTLSKMLWHNNVQTTIEYYGSRFNESSATVAMECWHEERAKKSRQMK